MWDDANTKFLGATLNRGWIKNIFTLQKALHSYKPLSVTKWIRSTQRFCFLSKINFQVQLKTIQGYCSCGLRYTAENKRNADVRWNKHNNPAKSSEPSKHLRNNIYHCFIWAMLLLSMHYIVLFLILIQNLHYKVCIYYICVI